MAIHWTARGIQAAPMLVLAATLCGCGGSDGPAQQVTLAPATAAGTSAPDRPGSADTDAALAAHTAGSGASDDPATVGSPAHPEGDGIAAAHARKDIYGIINLAGPPVFRAFINAKGQVAMEYEALDTSQHVGFFNGQQVIDIEPPGAVSRGLGGLNDKGVVAGQSRPSVPEGFQPFRYAPATGTVVLPSLNPNADTFTTHINNQGVIAGVSQPEVNGGFRAVRWTASNALVPLLTPPGFGESFAGVTNESNVTIGSAIAGDGNSHVLLWNAAAAPTDLGTFGAAGASGGLINNRGDFTGLLFTTPFEPSISFLQLRKGGFLPIIDPAGRLTIVNALTQGGLVAGRATALGIEHPYFFSKSTGYVNLERAPYTFGSANGLNESGVVVGYLGRTTAAGGEIVRAFRWSAGSFAAVDLNTRLLNPPNGLVLTGAYNLAANGDILANSNAGLVLLRHGGGGTDAPVLGPIQLTQPVRLNQPATLTLSFRDRNVRQTHTATVDWADGAGPQPALLREHHGKGTLTAQHTYVSNGLYHIIVRVTDSAGKSTALKTQISILELGGPGDTAAPAPAGQAAQGRGVPVNWRAQASATNPSGGHK